MTSLSLDLATHLSGFTADQLPSRVMHHARRYMLDYLGVRRIRRHPALVHCRAKRRDHEWARRG